MAVWAQDAEPFISLSMVEFQDAGVVKPASFASGSMGPYYFHSLGFQGFVDSAYFSAAVADGQEAVEDCVLVAVAACAWGSGCWFFGCVVDLKHGSRLNRTETIYAPV